MMKKSLVMLLLALALTTQAFGLFIKTADKVTIPKEMVITDNLFAAGKEVVIDGTVTGDLIAFGSKVVINGTVGGNLIAGGENVMINGVVKMDTFSGAKNLVFSRSARVAKDAFLGGGSVAVSGSIYRDLKVGASLLNVLDTAQVKGDLNYAAENISLSPSARIVGKVVVHQAPKVDAYKAQAKQAADKVMSVGRAISILMIALLAVLAIIFVPNQVRLVNTYMVDHFWLSILWGILALVLIPLAAILLLVTVIGLPLSILLFVAYFFGMYISVVPASIVIGRLILDKILKKEFSLIWAFLLGFLIIWLIGMVPILGGLARVIIFFWSFGALVMTRFIFYKEARAAGVL